MQFFTVTICLFSLLVSQSLWADDASLYDPKVGTDEALVRVVNTSSKPIKVDFLSAGKQLKRVGPLAISPYIRIKQGELKVSTAAAGTTLPVTARQLYTLVYVGNEFKVINDKSLNKKNKSLVNFYNLTPDVVLTLSTANGKAKIVPDVKPLSSGNRELNGVTVEMGIFQGENLTQKLEKAKLKKGESYDIVAFSGRNGQVVRLFKTRVDTRI